MVCELCGRRLHGKTRRVGDTYSYRTCEPVQAHHANRDWFSTHPRASGSARTSSWPWSGASSPAASSAPSAMPCSPPVRDLERQQANVVRKLREYQSTGDADIDRQWRTQLRENFAEIAAQRKDLPGSAGRADGTA